jgi:hypothetical protein
MEQADVTRALVAAPAPAPAPPFDLEEAPVFQAFVAEIQRLTRVRPAPGFATVADIPLPLILERSLWAVMVRVAEKAGIGYANEAALIDAAAPRATRLLAVALPFAHATPTAAAEAFVAAMPPAPSRPSERGEAWLAAASRSATDFFAAAIRAAAEKAGRFREMILAIRRRNRIPHRKLGELLEVDTFGFIPSEVLSVLLEAGDAVDAKFYIRTRRGPEDRVLSRVPWDTVRRWAETERRFGDVERDIEAAAPVVATLDDVPNDVQVPAQELAGAWVRTQVLLAALRAPRDRTWIESSELPLAIARGSRKTETSLRTAFVSRLRHLVGEEAAMVFLGRFPQMVDRRVRGLLEWGKKPDIRGPDLAGLVIRISAAPSPAVARAALKGGEGAIELTMEPDEAFAAFEWPKVTIEDFRLAMPSLQGDPWKMAQAFFLLPAKQRSGEADLLATVERALASDPEAYAHAARRAWVPLTWNAFEAISPGLAPHEALVILERFLEDAAEDTTDAERTLQGLFSALLRRVEPAAFQKLAWEPRLRDVVRVAIRRDVLDIGAPAGGHLRVARSAFLGILQVFGAELWRYYLLSIELTHRDNVWGLPSRPSLPEGRWFEPWPRMTQILRGDAEVEPADLGALLDVDDARRVQILADLTERKILRWTFEGQAGAKQASAEYLGRLKDYFAARGLAPDGKPLPAKPRPKANVPVERKARPSGALPSRPPRKR